MASRFLTISWIIILPLFIASCASSAPKQFDIDSVDAKAGAKDTLYVKNGRADSPDGYYVVIDKSLGSWNVTKVSRFPIKSRPNKNSEILYFDKELRYVEPVFEKIKYRSNHYFECTPLLDDKNAYTPCTSDLMTTNIGMSVGKNILAAGLTLGVAAGYHVVVDKEKVASAVEQSVALAQIRSQRAVLDAQFESHVAAKKQEAQRKEQIKQEKILAERRALLPQILQIGAKICKEGESNIYKRPVGNHYGPYVGFVEGIAGNKIQIRIASAQQQYIIWDDPLNWHPCN